MTGGKFILGSGCVAVDYHKGGYRIVAGDGCDVAFVPCDRMSPTDNERGVTIAAAIEQAINDAHTVVPHRLLTLNQAAAVLSISPRRLRMLAREGKVPRIELGWRTHLYEPEAVLAALKNLG